MNEDDPATQLSLFDPAPPEPRAAEPEQQRIPEQRAPQARPCPSCHRAPDSAPEQHARDIAQQWLEITATGQIAVRHFCAACQPHYGLAFLACELCGLDLFLIGELAHEVAEDRLPTVLLTWLAAEGWSPHPVLTCPSHAR
ncbi:hypothetical protein [Allokutzneria sp. NRRL B-24872]|uniref:hypothetical protein n=1 Tax=Allokutzneria sp. NRRL B-24872 TaxID=1137961 RepID=UPI000A3C31DE|nr:hypothetical protein [Allokutzneria sp. NRRL B-24872]